MEGLGVGIPCGALGAVQGGVSGPGVGFAVSEPDHGLETELALRAGGGDVGDAGEVGVAHLGVLGEAGEAVGFFFHDWGSGMAGTCPLCV